MKMQISKWYNQLIDNKFSISRAETIAGDYVEQELFNERPFFENIVYFGNNEKVVNRTDLYTFTKGKVKVTYTWTDDENISDEDVDFYISLLEQQEELLDAVKEKNTNSLSVTYEEQFKFNSWKDPFFKHELATDHKKTEMMTDGTECVCVISSDPECKIKHLALKSQTSADTNKQGNDCYLYFAGAAKVNVGETVKNTDKDQVIKFDSSFCTIENNTDNDFMVIMIYK